MEEKRKHKRLDLDVSVQLERLDKDGVTTLKYVHVDVTDISRSGIGFSSKQKLEVGTYYDTKIVRRVDAEGGSHYGASFIGMTDTDALKIDIYQIFNDL